MLLAWWQLWYNLHVVAEVVMQPEQFAVVTADLGLELFAHMHLLFQ